MASTAMKANASKSAPVCRCVGKGGGGGRGVRVTKLCGRQEKGGGRMG